MRPPQGSACSASTGSHATERLRSSSRTMPGAGCGDSATAAHHAAAGENSLQRRKKRMPSAVRTRVRIDREPVPPANTSSRLRRCLRTIRQGRRSRLPYHARTAPDSHSGAATTSRGQIRRSLIAPLRARRGGPPWPPGLTSTSRGWSRGCPFALLRSSLSPPQGPTRGGAKGRVVSPCDINVLGACQLPSRRRRHDTRGGPRPCVGGVDGATTNRICVPRTRCSPKR
jgi:hypothetical protein